MQQQEVPSGAAGTVLEGTQGDFSPSDVPTGTGSTGTSVDVSGSTSVDVGTPTSASVSETLSGFSPQKVVVKKGGTVTWSGPSNMWVASAPHPAHTGYDGTSRETHCASGYSGAKPFDECATGSSYSFTFDKVGTWNYHDHNASQNFGQVVVVE